MNEQELLVYNNGERLLPDISHNEAEKIRHFSSYEFFKQMILEEQQFRSDVPTIIDIGCGVGFGCKILSEIPHVTITGIDCCETVIAYAKEHYSSPNITYYTQDLMAFIPFMSNSYDYVVSRGVFEHLDNGFDLIKKVTFNRLFIFDVPYNEKPGNSHHKLLNITERDFEDLSNYELYYEDINGVITKEKTNTVNMIMCVCYPKNGD